ncbi:MAG TPA: hypothetical protein VGL59_21245 [Polyangia bacterium]|jgi:class 3 adenylate cyclase
MSGRNFTINMSGGAATFGNVVRGDKNQVSAQQRDWAQTVDAAFARGAGDARHLGQQLGVSEEQVAALLKDVRALKALAAARPPEVAKPGLGERLEQLGEKFAWATPALKTLAETILPKVAAALF